MGLFAIFRFPLQKKRQTQFQTNFKKWNGEEIARHKVQNKPVYINWNHIEAKKPDEV